MTHRDQLQQHRFLSVPMTDIDLLANVRDLASGVNFAKFNSAASSDMKSSKCSDDFEVGVTTTDNS